MNSLPGKIAGPGYPNKKPALEYSVVNVLRFTFKHRNPKQPELSNKALSKKRKYTISSFPAP